MVAPHRQPAVRALVLPLFQRLGYVTSTARTLNRCAVWPRSEEHTSELQSHVNLVCRLLLEKKNFAIPFSLVELRRRRAIAAAVALLPLAAWPAFRIEYYGALLPVTHRVQKRPFACDLASVL